MPLAGAIVGAVSELGGGDVAVSKADTTLCLVSSLKVIKKISLSLLYD